MLWVIVTLLVLLSISVVIIAAVAVPRLREEGTQILTPRGEQVLREARARLTSSGSEAEEGADQERSASR